MSAAVRLETPVQLNRRAGRERVGVAVPTPRDLGDEEVTRLLLDVPTSELRLIEQIATFRNALAAVQKKKLKRQWSRKSLAEHFISDQLLVAAQQYQQMFEEVGPFPEISGTADEKRAVMEEYAKLVIAWTEKLAKQQAKKNSK
jgi:hypothetical protein